MLFFLMIRRPPRSTRTDTLFPDTTLFRSRYGIVKDNRTGYSIGLSYPPDWGERTMSLRGGDTTELQPGMTLHFMTGLWLDDWGFETTESIVITDSGPRCLASVPRKLLVKD